VCSAVFCYSLLALDLLPSLLYSVVTCFVVSFSAVMCFVGF
jgi:hypothetical protein